MKQRYQTFTNLILNISRCIQKIKNEEMAALGLKGKQVQCLFFLYNMPDGATPTELCELCDEDKGAMSRTIKELTKKGLVCVDEQSEHKYRNPLKLTPDGKFVAKVVTDKIGTMVAKGADGVSEAERDTFYSTLTRVADNLTKICENYGGKDDQDLN